MTARTHAERLNDVRAVVRAAQRVHDARGSIAPEVARTTGLSREGVLLAFDEHIELAPSSEELEALVEGAAHTERVHVILSAGVFVGALRALAVARAAASVVTLHASRRDPVFARALVARLADPRVTLSDDAGAASEIHVYGRDETTAMVLSAAAPGVIVRCHGSGLGVAFVSRENDLEASAMAVAADVVPFDQRGCLSPRIVLVEGDEARAGRFAAALSDELGRSEERVPRGALSASERAEATRYGETLAFAGQAFRGSAHVVGCAPGPLLLPPPGRHVHVRAASDTADARACLAPVARLVVAVGADDRTRAAGWAPTHARLSALGRMQRPPLDGPVDLRRVAS